MLSSLKELAKRLAEEPLSSTAPDAGRFISGVSEREDGKLSVGEAERLPREVVEAYRKLRSALYVGKRMRLVQFLPAELPRVFTGDVGQVADGFTIRFFDDVRVAMRGFRAESDDDAFAFQGVGARVVGIAPVADRASLTMTWADQHLYLGLDGALMLRAVPLGHGLHALYEVNPEGLPIDHADTAAMTLPYNVPSTLAPPYSPGTVDSGSPSQQDADGNHIIWVAVGFTAEAANVYGGLGNVIERLLLVLTARFLITRANYTLANSGAKVKLRSKRAARVGAVESVLVPSPVPPIGWTPVMLDLARPEWIEAFNLHCWWGSTGASVMVLVGDFGGPPTDPNNDVGFAGVTRKPSGVWTLPGLAKIYDEAVQGYAVGTVAYAVVKLHSAINHHTFTHEVAHMMGADHEASERGIPLRLLTGGTPVLLDTARGHVIQNAPLSRKVTLMCVGERSSDRRNREGLISTTTSVPIPPVQMPPGTAGTADEDNVRIMNHLGPWLSRHRPPTCP